jgi:hypothetical protein
MTEGKMKLQLPDARKEKVEPKYWRFFGSSLFCLLISSDLAKLSDLAIIFIFFSPFIHEDRRLFVRRCEGNQENRHSI